MKKTIITLVSIILGGIALDQLTKILVLKLMHLGQSIELIPGVFNITYIQNEGAAFGMLSEHRWIFMITSTVAIIGIGIYLFGFCRERMTLKVGLAMIISGGVGNMIDRTAYGFVVDMIDFRMLDSWIWMVDVAYAVFFVGAGVVMLALILDVAQAGRERK